MNTMDNDSSRSNAVPQPSIVHKTDRSNLTIFRSPAKFWKSVEQLDLCDELFSDMHAKLTQWQHLLTTSTDPIVLREVSEQLSQTVDVMGIVQPIMDRLKQQRNDVEQMETRLEADTISLQRLASAQEALGLEAKRNMSICHELTTDTCSTDFENSPTASSTVDQMEDCSPEESVNDDVEDAQWCRLCYRRCNYKEKGHKEFIVDIESHIWSNHMKTSRFLCLRCNSEVMNHEVQHHLKECQNAQILDRKEELSFPFIKFLKECFPSYDSSKLEFPTISKLLTNCPDETSPPNKRKSIMRSPRKFCRICYKGCTDISSHIWAIHCKRSRFECSKCAGSLTYKNRVMSGYQHFQESCPDGHIVDMQSEMEEYYNGWLKRCFKYSSRSLVNSKKKPQFKPSEVNSPPTDPKPSSLLTYLAHVQNQAANSTETADSVTEEIATIDSDNKKRCQICQTVVSQKFVQQHVWNTHMNTKRFMCSKCGFDCHYGGKRQIEYHVKTKCAGAQLVDNTRSSLKFQYNDIVRQCFPNIMPRIRHKISNMNVSAEGEIDESGEEVESDISFNSIPDESDNPLAKITKTEESVENLSEFDI